MWRKKVNAKVLGLSVVSLMIALNGLFLFSQVTGGTFTGTVTDQHGAVIADTQIRIRSSRLESKHWRQQTPTVSTRLRSFRVDNTS